LTETILKLLDYQDRFTHRRINLMRMPNVETKGRLWESLKDRAEIARSLPNRLPLIHVFNA
jgi:hypothetical protein